MTCYYCARRACDLCEEGKCECRHDWKPPEESTSNPGGYR